MAYYVLIEGNITNTTKYSKYREAVTPLVGQFGGRYLVRGGETQVFEGQHGEWRHVVIEFPTQEDAEAFWSSPEYAVVKKLREGASEGYAIGVEGV